MHDMSRQARAETKISRSVPPDPAKVRKKNRVVLKYLLTGFLIVDGMLALLLAYLFFLHVPYFNLQQVEVTGIRRLSRAEVIEASEIEAGINLLTVDLGAIAMRLQRHPWIRSATVFRRFPGSLIVEIEERTPRAILAAEKLYYVDEQAQYFTRLLPGDPVEYPLFTGIGAEDLKNNGAEIQEMIRQGLALLELLERCGSGVEPAAVSEIRLSIEDGLAVQTRSGRLIVLGNDNFEEKIQRFGRLQKFLTRSGEWHNARTINLDFEDRALVRWDRSRQQG